MSSTADLSLVGLVALWYGASLIAVASAKTVLLSVACPASLCSIQFAVALVGARQLSLRRFGKKGAAAIGKEYLQLESAEYWTVAAIGATYALGFLLTNAAIAIAAPSFVETVKSAEPLSTVGLAMVVLGEREALVSLASLIPLVVGVAMASSTPSTFSGVGLVLALCSNIAFSGRAILTKILKRSHPTARASGSDACLFYHVSRFGLCLLLPVAVALDARALIVALVTSEAPIGLLLVANGSAHALYNGVSFMVLNRVSVATHAVLNIIRRVCVIAFAAAVFGTPISFFNWVGIALAAIGVSGFGYSKHSSTLGGSGAVVRERVGAGRQLLLPVSDRDAHQVRSV